MRTSAEMKLTIVQSNSLPDLAHGIKSDHKEVEAAKGSGLKYAVAAGHKLIEAKGLVKQSGGKWLEWVEKNCGFDISTAQRYMRVAKYGTPVPHLSFRNALKAISKPRKPERARVTEKKKTGGARSIDAFVGDVIREHPIDTLAAVSDVLRATLKKALPEMDKQERTAMAVELHGVIDELIRVANVNDKQGNGR